VRRAIVALVVALAAAPSTPAHAQDVSGDAAITVTRVVTLADLARDGRTVETTITYQAGSDAVPLVVLAHGSNGHPSKFTQLMGAWAEAGYVVAAPAFPAGSSKDQVADMTFVIDEVLAMSRDEADPLFGLVDTRHIGAAGLSLGGGTVYALVYNTCCRDKRVDAVVLMSTIRIQIRGSKEKFPELPAMLIAGDADPISRVTESVYELLSPPKWKVVLFGGTHSGPFEDTPDPADQVVRDITTEFWNLSLKNDARSERSISKAVEQYCDAELVNQLDRSTGEGFACQRDTESAPTS